MILGEFRMYSTPLPPPARACTCTDQRRCDAGCVPSSSWWPWMDHKSSDRQLLGDSLTPLSLVSADRSSSDPHAKRSRQPFYSSSMSRYTRTMFFSWTSTSDLQGATVVFTLFGQSGGIDWVCSSVLSLASVHGIILSIAIDTSWIVGFVIL